jgi:hypothetical protein
MAIREQAHIPPTPPTLTRAKDEPGNLRHTFDDIQQRFWDVYRSVSRLADGIEEVTVTFDEDVTLAEQTFVTMDASGGNRVVYLPPAASELNRRLTIKKIDATTNTVTIRAQTGEYIDDNLSEKIIDIQNAALMVVSDGTQWWAIAAGNPGTGPSAFPAPGSDQQILYNDNGHVGAATGGLWTDTAIVARSTTAPQLIVSYGTYQTATANFNVGVSSTGRVTLDASGAAADIYAVDPVVLDPTVGNAVALTIVGASNQTASVAEVKNSDGAVLMEVDDEIRVGIRDTSCSALLNLKASGDIPTEQDILELGPFVWYKSTEPLNQGSVTTPPSDTNQVTFLHDKSGNGRYISMADTDPAVPGAVPSGKRPRYWTTAAGISGRPTTLANNKPVIGHLGAGSLGDDTATGMWFPPLHGYPFTMNAVTIYVVRQKIASTSVQVPMTGGYNPSLISGAASRICFQGTDIQASMIRGLGSGNGYRLGFTSPATNVPISFPDSGTWHRYTLTRATDGVLAAWVNDSAQPGPGFQDGTATGTWEFAYIFNFFQGNGGVSITTWPRTGVNWTEFIVFEGVHDSTTRALVWRYLDSLYYDGTNYTVGTHLGGSSSFDLLHGKDDSGNVLCNLDSDNRLAVGWNGTSNVHRLAVRDTSQQLAVQYDGSNQLTLSVTDAGVVGYDAAGGSARHEFYDPLFNDTQICVGSTYASPKFNVNGVGNITKINNVTYSWPTANGAVNDVLQDSNGAGTLVWGKAGIAPSDAQYLVLATNASLSNERVFTPGSDLTATDAGANGAYTLNLATTGVVAATYGGTATYPVITVDSKGRITSASNQSASSGDGSLRRHFLFMGA